MVAIGMIATLGGEEKAASVCEIVSSKLITGVSNKLLTTSGVIEENRLTLTLDASLAIWKALCGPISNPLASNFLNN